VVPTSKTTATTPTTASAPLPSVPVVPVLPKAVVEPAHFGDIKALVPDGSKSKDVDALLTLEGDSMVVRNKDNGSLLKALTYQTIGAATYVDSRKPRWKDDPSLAMVPNGFAGGGFFLKSSKHWLTLQTPNEFIILRLDDKNVVQVIKTLESRAGLKVLRPESEDKN
jgi:hypothetical protein